MSSPLVCVHCGHEMVGEIPNHTGFCPECSKPILLRGRARLGGFVYCQGVVGKSAWHPLFPSDWSADELEAIARDIRLREATGELKYPDGSGPGKAGREARTTFRPPTDRKE